MSEVFWIFLKGLWPLWALIVIVALGKLAYQLWEKQRLAKSGIDDIDNMSGKTFEKYLEVLFEKLGYRVERTRYVGDYGPGDSEKWSKDCHPGKTL
jgi:restriction system protein